MMAKNYIVMKHSVLNITANVRCYISVAGKHKTIFRFMTEINKYKKINEFNTITAIEYSSCYK